MFLAIIIFLTVLGLLIFSHELGHFLVAKKSGVKVDEFGIFFPPKIYSFKRGETTYSINLIPLGGFVKIHGENGQDKKNKRSFASRSVLERAKILAAGVGMNIVLAAILLTIVSIFIYPWYQGFYMGIVNTFYLLWFILKSLYTLLWQLITTGHVIGEVMGPIGIASFTGQVVKAGFLNLLYFTAILSINLAIINLFPFPALDGGRLFFLLIEKIKGRPVKAKIEHLVHSIGLVVLIGLMILISWRDIVRFF